MTIRYQLPNSIRNFRRKLVIATILLLLSGSSPTHVSRFVVSITVRPSVNAESFRCGTHVSKKVFESAPSITNDYTHVAMVFSLISRLPMASLYHRCPCPIGWSSGHSMRNWRIQSLPHIASTTHNIPNDKVLPQNAFDGSTFTTAKPSQSLLAIFGIERNDGQSTENLPCHVLFFVTTAICRSSAPQVVGAYRLHGATRAFANPSREAPFVTAALNDCPFTKRPTSEILKFTHNVYKKRPPCDASEGAVCAGLSQIGEPASLESLRREHFTPGRSIVNLKFPCVDSLPS